MPLDPDKYVATTIATSTRQRLREFKTLLLRRGIPEGVEAPSALTISTTIDVALDLAIQAMAGVGVVLNARTKKR